MGSRKLWICSGKRLVFLMLGLFAFDYLQHSIYSDSNQNYFFHKKNVVTKSFIRELAAPSNFWVTSFSREKD